jgi:hypothetical protein
MTNAEAKEEVLRIFKHGTFTDRLILAMGAFVAIVFWLVRVIVNVFFLVKSKI